MEATPLVQLTPIEWPGSVELLAGFQFRPYGFSDGNVLPKSLELAVGPSAGVRLGAQHQWVAGRAEATVAGLFGTEWTGNRPVLESELAVEIHPWAKPGAFTASLGLAWTTYVPLASDVAVLPTTHQFGVGLTLGVPTRPKD